MINCAGRSGSLGTDSRCTNRKGGWSVPEAARSSRRQEYLGKGDVKKQQKSQVKKRKISPCSNRIAVWQRVRPPGPTRAYLRQRRPAHPRGKATGRLRKSGVWGTTRAQCQPMCPPDAAAPPPLRSAMLLHAGSPGNVEVAIQAHPWFIPSGRRLVRLV